MTNAKTGRVRDKDPENLTTGATECTIILGRGWVPGGSPDDALHVQRVLEWTRAPSRFGAAIEMARSKSRPHGDLDSATPICYTVST